MARRRAISIQGKVSAAGAALALLALWHAGPAAASSNTPLVPADVAKTANQLDELSPEHSRTPRAEATLRKVFEGAATPLAKNNGPIARKRPAMTTRLPGVSDERLARYKRQMNRSDI